MAMSRLFPQSELTQTPAEQAQRGLLLFTTCTKPDYAANWHHAELARMLDRVAAGDCRRLMIFLPPQHGKSELVSRRFPAFMLGRNPDLRLICASHTHDLAVSLNRDVQRIMTGDAYARIFPHTALNLSPRPLGDAQGAGLIVFLGVGSDKLFYVDAILDRIPLDQIVRKTVLFCDEKRPHMVGIEAEQFQELLVHEFRRQCGQRFALRWPMYKMMTGGVPKIARIRRLSQYVINRELRFKADSPGCRLLVDQLMDFPLADHDDGPDALEMCTRLPLEAY
jgi:predicted phage terminase large subunit-like protein